MPIKLKESVIKCDNPNCDYINRDVAIEDFHNWVDKPCPKCGSNLLTNQDYKTLEGLLHMINILNILLPEEKESEKTSITFRSDGSGNVFFKNNERT